MIQYVKIVFGYFVGLFAFDLFTRQGADTPIFWRSFIAAILATLLLWLLTQSSPHGGRH